MGKPTAGSRRRGGGSTGCGGVVTRAAEAARRCEGRVALLAAGGCGDGCRAALLVAAKGCGDECRAALLVAAKGCGDGCRVERACVPRVGRTSKGRAEEKEKALRRSCGASGGLDRCVG